MNLNKLHKIKVKPDAKSSRFVVDLNQEPTAAEAKEIKNNSLVIESKLEKLAELDYKKYFSDSQAKVKAIILNFKDNFLNLNWGPDSLSSIKTLGQRDKVTGEILIQPKRYDDSIMNQLAFVALIKLLLVILKTLFGWFYKTCYITGWVIIFILRFIYLILKAAVKPATNYFLTGYSIVHRDIKAVFKKLLKEKAGSFSLNDNSRTALIGQTSPLGARAIDSETNLRGEKIGYLRPVIVFAGVLLILVLPVKAYTFYKTIDGAKGRVLGASESAMNNLVAGGQAAVNFDFTEADKSFSLAGENFLSAGQQLNDIGGLLFALASIIPNKNLQLASVSKNAVKAGELSAAAGKNLSLAAASLFNYKPEAGGGIISDLSFYGHAAVANLTALTNEIDRINSDFLPEAYQKEFILLKQKTSELNRGLRQFIGLVDNLENFLGGRATKRYLLVFQNNSELRASGGFIGSFALIDIAGGKIKKLEVPGGGSYDTDAGLLKKIKSPEPLRLVRPDWHFWDANWWPDWPTTAKKLAWFYENSDGSTVDGVIGLTPTVMERLLKVIGGIDLREKYGVFIEADNFWAVTQEFAEQKPSVTKQPKKIIGDLMNKIIEELPSRLNKDNLIDLLKAVEQSLADKNILFYFSDHGLQAKAEELGWDGGLKETAGDFLSVINTNIAGGKSDRRIKQQIIHRAEIGPDGTIIDHLTIKRTHEAVKREAFSGVRNVNWLRIYVPLGSKLISATGFKPVDKIFFKAAEDGWKDDPNILAGEAQALTDELTSTKIYNELNKTVFANWSQVDPGEATEINIKYRLPFKLIIKEAESGASLTDRLIFKAGSLIGQEQKNLYAYSLLAQKQPGMNSSTIESELKISDNFEIIWNFPGDLSLSRNGWSATGNFDQDKLMAVMLEE